MTRDKADKAAEKLFGDYWATKETDRYKAVGTFGAPHLAFKEYGRGKTWEEALRKARKQVKT